MGEFSAAAYKAAKKYADDTLKGLGAIKGSPCTIKSITEGEDGATIVFAWTGSDGVEQTETAFVRRGPQGDPGEALMTRNQIVELINEMMGGN